MPRTTAFRRPRTRLGQTSGSSVRTDPGARRRGDPVEPERPRLRGRRPLGRSGRTLFAQTRGAVAPSLPALSAQCTMGHHACVVFVFSHASSSCGAILTVW